MFTGYSSYSFGFNNPVMFGDPSGMAPEKHQKGGGDVLLGSGSLFKYLGLYSATTTASYAVVTHRERVLVGVQRYKINDVTYDIKNVDYSLNPLTLEKQKWGYAGVYEMQNVSRLVKISGGVPSGGPGPGGGGDSRSSYSVGEGGSLKVGNNTLTLDEMKPLERRSEVIALDTPYWLNPKEVYEATNNTREKIRAMGQADTKGIEFGYEIYMDKQTGEIITSEPHKGEYYSFTYWHYLYPFTRDKYFLIGVDHTHPSSSPLNYSDLALPHKIPEASASTGGHFIIFSTPEDSGKPTTFAYIYDNAKYQMYMKQNYTFSGLNNAVTFMQEVAKKNFKAVFEAAEKLFNSTNGILYGGF